MADTEITGSEKGPPSEYSQDGVDLSLIRWMLSRTPAERLAFLQQRIDAIEAIRNLNGGR